jgi:hypothetical protein
VGIHPTTAEEFTTMSVLKVSSETSTYPLSNPYLACTYYKWILVVKWRQRCQEGLLRIDPSAPA